MIEKELKEALPEIAPREAVLTDWLVECKDRETREAYKSLLLESSIQFRNLRRIVRGLFNSSVSRTYDIMGKHDPISFNAFELGYRKALNDVWKMIPLTKGDKYDN